MTVAAQNVAPQAVATPGQTIFPFAWRCDDSARVLVWVNDVQDGGFVVALNADQIAAPGGTITRGVACLGGEVVTVERSTPLTQTTALTQYTPFPASTITNVLDYVTEIIQEVWALLGRVLRVSRANASKMSSFDWPAPVAGAVLAWVQVGAQFQLSSVLVSVLPAQFSVLGEQLADSGDHIHFTSAFVPTVQALYRNGQRIFSPGDFTVVGNTWTLVVALNPVLGETLNADYGHA